MSAALLSALLPASTHACAMSEPTTDPRTLQPALEVLALSRGRGVPEPTWSAFQSILSRVEGARGTGEVVAIKTSTLGLEGETRLCVVFRDMAAFEEIGGELRAIASGVELLQLKQTPCPAR